MKKKVVVFTGAGISKESGIETLRDVKDGLWNNYKIEDVATPKGWNKNKEAVLQFYNERRRQLNTVFPNMAHKVLVELENKYDVNIIIQNVDNLHEKAGSSNIIHLHGELTKARGSLYSSLKIPNNTIIDIGYNDINIGDKCKISDSQLRPHIVWFGEYPLSIIEAYSAVEKADILLIVGTSLQIGYTLDMLNNVRHIGDDAHSSGLPCRVIYIDPNPTRYLDNYGIDVEYINKPATVGVSEIVNELLK